MIPCDELSKDGKYESDFPVLWAFHVLISRRGLSAQASIIDFWELTCDERRYQPGLAWRLENPYRSPSSHNISRFCGVHTNLVTTGCAITWKTPAYIMSRW